MRLETTLPTARDHTQALPSSTCNIPPTQHGQRPSAPPAGPTSQTVVVTPTSSSACAPWVIVLVTVLAVMVISGGITVGVIVATNNNINIDDLDVNTVENPCEFRCHGILSPRCISQSEVCDGDWDCTTGEDEMGCIPNEDMPICYGYNCTSGTPSGTGCIPLSWKCDGFADCSSGEDEYGCTSTPQTNITCGASQFTCFDGSCIPGYWECDNSEDCTGGEDEADCGITCTSSQFTCSDGNCIPGHWECDNYFDCTGGEDEDCATTCDALQYACTDGSCIPGHWECDNYVDCTEGEDEANCPCNSYQFRCENGSAYGSCIYNYRLCNGIKDCNDGADEVNCESCASNSFHCNGTCIPNLDVCDGYPHCNDSSDEENCHPNCSSYEFLCTSGSDNYYGYCISIWWRCDNDYDCPEGEDEERCDNITCTAFQFTCTEGGHNGRCIPDNWECDNVADCTGATDEANCSCSSNQYRCQNGSDYGSCISSHKVCDGIDDCNDGADEAGCADKFICEDPISASTIIISKERVCDGMEDCLGGVDENKCLIAPNGADGGMVNIYNVANDTYHNFCSDNWIQNTGDEACAAMGYSALTSMKNVISSVPVRGILVDADGSFNMSKLVHRSPVDCPLNSIVEFKCSHNETCGLMSKNQLKIVGGEDTTIAQHPWQVSLQYTYIWSSTWTFFCGGSIIGKDRVLTAAHCFDSMSVFASYRVVAGVTSLTQTVSPTINAYSMKTIVPHPLYNSHTMQFDVALIQVDKNFILSSTIQYVCLPAPGELFPDISNVSITGWGSTYEGGNKANILQAATVQLYNTDSCRSNFPSLTNHIYDGMICAGYASGGVDSCQGDSGGPLTLARNSREYLVGVTSWGYGCARPGLPGVYAEVSNVVDWITSESQKLE